jgi:hypothetical protein
MAKMVDHRNWRHISLDVPSTNPVEAFAILANSRGQTFQCVNQFSGDVNWIAAAWTPTGTRKPPKIPSDRQFPVDSHPSAATATVLK